MKKSMMTFFGWVFFILFLGVSAVALMGILKNASLKGVVATLKDGLAEADRENDELTRELQRITIAAERLSKEHGSLKEKYAELLNEKEELERDLSELNVARQTLNKRVEELELELGEVTKDKARIEAELSSLSARIEAELSSLSARLAPGEEVELQEIVVKPVQRGRVIKVNDEYKFVVINLGQGDGVKRGMVFGVYRRGRRKGSVRVIEVRKHVAAARIEEERVRRRATIKENDAVKLKE